MAKDPVGGSGRELTPGHPIDIVVEHHYGKVNVPACGMDQVVAANGGAIAVASDDNNGELGSGHFNTCSKGNGPAVSGMNGVEIHITGSPGRTADTGNDHHFVLLQPQIVDGLGHIPHKDAVAAAGTPDMGQVSKTHILMNELAFHFYVQPFFRSDWG